MSSHAISYIKELRDSGIPTNQAEAIYSVVQSNLQYKYLATKTDLNLAISEVRHEIKDLRLTTKTDLNLAINEVRHQIKDLRVEMHTTISDVKLEITKIHAQMNKDMNQLGYKFFLALGAASIGIVSFLQYFKN